MDMSQKVEGKKTPDWLSTHPASHRRAELFDCLLHKVVFEMIRNKMDHLRNASIFIHLKKMYA